MKKRYTSFVTAFLKEHNAPRELLDAWRSEQTQDRWNRLYITTAPKKRCTSYILYCMDKRRHMISTNPGKTPAEITSMLAANWREHKGADDEVYRYYTDMDAKQVFCKRATAKMTAKYPTMDSEEISVLVEKMYRMSKSGRTAPSS